MLSLLASKRYTEEVGDRPIIFIAHSLGGILLQQVLELSYNLHLNDKEALVLADNATLRSIYVSTYGIMFLGTPRTESTAVKLSRMIDGMAIAPMPETRNTYNDVKETLQTTSVALGEISLKFVQMLQTGHSVQLCMVHETQPTNISLGLIVDQRSAAPMLPEATYFGLEATHAGMTKFESEKSPGYSDVAMTIRSWVQNGNLSISP